MAGPWEKYAEAAPADGPWSRYAEPADVQPDTSAARGFALGATKPLDNLTSAAMQIPGVAALDRLGQRMGFPGAGDAVAGNDAARANNTRTGFQMAGNIAGTLPTLALPGGALVEGAAGGALLSNADSAGGVLTDAVYGAAGSKAGQVVAKGVGAVIAPKLSGAAARLRDMGVQLTPGRAMGAVASRVEDLVSKLPGANLTAPAAMKQMQEGFARGVIDKALAPIKAALPKGISAGYEAVDFANRQLSDAYTKLTPKLSAKIDNQFVGRVNVLRQRAGLTAEADALFEQELSRVVLDAFDPATGLARGKALKGLDERLGKLSAGYSRSQDYAQREVGDLLADVREQVFSLVARSTPEAAKELRDVNKAYAMFKRVQKATAQASDADGVFTPNQFRAAVRASDRSKDKSAFARGNALLQQEASDGVSVIPEKVGDSGTAERVLTGLGGVAALSGGVAPAVIGGMAAGAGVFSRPAVAGLNRVLQQPGPFRQGMRGALNTIGRGAPLVAPALLARPRE